MVKKQSIPMARYRTFDSWLKNLHGQKVQKIPLDAASACPNRDGTLGKNGCVFCNPDGSGSGLAGKGLSITEQWHFWRHKFAESDRLKNTHLFLAYIQSYSNTYGSIKRLKNLMNQLQSLPEMVGLAIGTRPDCLDREKLHLLARQPWKEIWLELGVQSMNDTSLKRINRGHDAESSRQAILSAHEYGLKVCVHIMAGLPGEDENAFMQTLEEVCKLPISGIKFHGLYVCQGTQLAKDWQLGDYVPLEQSVYEELIAKALIHTPPHIVIHRLTADPAQGELLAPAWASQKGSVVRHINEILQIHDWYQGCKIQ